MTVQQQAGVTSACQGRPLKQVARTAGDVAPSTLNALPDMHGHGSGGGPGSARLGFCGFGLAGAAPKPLLAAATTATFRRREAAAIVGANMVTLPSVEAQARDAAGRALS